MRRIGRWSRIRLSVCKKIDGGEMRDKKFLLLEFGMGAMVNSDEIIFWSILRIGTSKAM